MTDFATFCQKQGVIGEKQPVSLLFMCFGAKLISEFHVVKNFLDLHQEFEFPILSNGILKAL